MTSYFFSSGCRRTMSVTSVSIWFTFLLTSSLDLADFWTASRFVFFSWPFLLLCTSLFTWKLIHVSMFLFFFPNTMNSTSNYRWATMKWWLGEHRTLVYLSCYMLWRLELVLDQPCCSLQTLFSLNSLLAFAAKCTLQVNFHKLISFSFFFSFSLIVGQTSNFLKVCLHPPLVNEKVLFQFSMHSNFLMNFLFVMLVISFVDRIVESLLC